MIPKSLAVKHQQFQIDTPGQWLILGDLHIPQHEEGTIRLALAEAKKLRVAGIIINGDLLDSGAISFHKRHSLAPLYADEIAMGQVFLKHLRDSFPKARIIYKEGNHEERLDAYVMQNASALAGLSGISVPEFCGLSDLGIEWVGDSRVIRLGKLSVIHGHEYRGSGGVNPARWLFLRAGDCAITSHFHRTSEHHDKNITGYKPACWSIGCACDEHPEWLPGNGWNQGFATVYLDNKGGFEVRNRRVISGKVV